MYSQRGDLRGRAASKVAHTTDINVERFETRATPTRCRDRENPIAVKATKTVVDDSCFE